jgi:hypothetical protein
MIHRSSKPVDGSWLSGQIYKFGLYDPKLFGGTEGEFLEFVAGGKKYTIEIASIHEVLP